MGYYTNFELEIIENPEATDEEFVLFSVQKQSEYNWDGSTLSEAKWYDHDSDMLTVSKKFPQVVFKLHGEGEENGDEWVSYYKNGKSVTHSRSEWTPPEYHESDLC